MNKFLKIFFFSLIFTLYHALLPYDLFSQLVSDFKVNDDTTNTEEFSAKLGFDSLGNFTTVWRDQRNNRPNVYGQRFNSNGIFLGQNFKINVNPDSSGAPQIAVAKSGIFGVSWVETNGTLNLSSKVKFRLFDSNFQPLTGEVVINDTNGNFSGPLSMDVNNINHEFIITWSNGNILDQKIDSVGNKIGRNVIVNDVAGFYFHTNPALTVRQDGSFIITWSDTRPPSMTNADDIYMQMYDKFGNNIGTNQMVNDDANINNLQEFPEISSDASGQFVIAWGDNRNDNDHSEVYAQIYSNNGSKIGMNFRVTQSPTIVTKGLSAIDLRYDGSFIIYWTEFHNFIGQPFFQRFNSQGEFIGNNFLVTPYFPDLEKFSSDIKIFHDKIISVWTDARNGPFDIYCNIRSFSNPDTTVNMIRTSSTIPSKFELFQNYPNPFNPVTKIQYSIPIEGNVKIIIYNSLGQEVKVLINEIKQPGTYSILFNAINFGSGIYYYRMETSGFVQTRKMLLLK